MIPILYDKYETEFRSNGLGQLADCLTCTVTEEVNGIYECEFTYPMTGAYYEQLINYGGVVAVEHEHNSDIQLFDIYKYSAPIGGIVTFYASHVSYRLADYVRYTDIISVPPSISLPSSPAELFSLWNDPETGLFPPLGEFIFTDHTGYTGESWVVPSPYAVRDAMMNTADDNQFPGGSVMQRWKGEWEFDNFRVDYYKKRGQDRGVQIRYGKNMTNVLREKDTGGVVSVIVPYWVSSGGTVTNYEPVYSPYMEHVVSPWQSRGEQMYYGDEMFYLRPAEMKPIPLNISDQFENEPTEAEAREYCLSYMSKNSTWRANDNITVDFLDLYGVYRDEGLERLAYCRVGDYVSILYPQLGIVSEGVEIMSLTYDVLGDRVTQMQLNSIRTSLAQVILSEVNK